MHRFIPDPTAEAPATINPEHTVAIKHWTARLLHLAADDTVHVAEIACADAGCPLVETWITVISAEAGNLRRWHLVRPRSTVTKMMLQQTLATPPLDVPATLP